MSLWLRLDLTHITWSLLWIGAQLDTRVSNQRDRREDDSILFCDGHLG